MSDLICVTNRHLCRGDFLTQIEKVAGCHLAGIILREKDLAEEEYLILAKKVLKICEKHQVSCILHTFFRAAIQLGVQAVHLPLPLLRTMSESEKSQFKVLGASCHSREDALEAEQLGCTYITAGHVFVTDCKKGLPPRGIPFLEEVCSSVSIPVYAIGGINLERMEEVRKAGAAGACMMSELMQK